MKSQISVSPKNSLILIMDKSFGIIPDFMTSNGLSFNSSCVAIGTLAEMDGQTRIILSNLEDGHELGDIVFEGLIDTPGKTLSVLNTDVEELLSISLLSEKTRLKILTNDPNEPDLITILVNSCI